MIVLSFCDAAVVRVCRMATCTALMGALEYGHTDVVKHLVEHKADVNAKNRVFTAFNDG